MRKIYSLFIVVMLVFSVTIVAQPTVFYTNLTSTTNPALTNSRLNLTDLGAFRQTRFQTTVAPAPAPQTYAFHTGTDVSPNYNDNWRPYTPADATGIAYALNTVTVPSTVVNSARYNSGGGGTDGNLAALANNTYYTVNIQENAGSDNLSAIWATTFNPVTFSAVTQAPIAGSVNPGNPVTVSITASAALGTGENVFVRYSTNGYTTSSVVQATFVATAGTAVIPGQLSGANVSYYIFSSNRSLAQLTTIVGTAGIGQAGYDMATLNLQNNAGANYAYTVNAGANPVVVTATGGALNGDYVTLKTALDSINSGYHTGVIAITINQNTTETATATLNASGTGLASYASVNISASIPVTVSGNIVGAIIRLNGADNVTIDGRIAGTGRNITVSNTSTSASTAAIWLSSNGVGAGATNNTIRNLELRAGATQNTGTNSTFGIIMCGNTISTTSNGDDNDSNSFIDNRIMRVRYGIVTRGVTTNNNQNITVSDNLIGPAAFGADQIGKVGIFMQADNNSTVTRNTVQFVGGEFANTTVGADRVGIAIGTESWSMAPGTITSANYTVTRNIVHDVIEERTFSAVGLLLGTTGGGSPTNNLVANNFIYNVKSNGTSGDHTVGLGISGGHTDRVVYNSIYLSGDVDPNPGATATSNFGSGIRIGNTSGTTHANLTLQNNSVYMDLSSSSTAATRYYAISGPSAAYSFGTGGENYNNYYINPANTQLQTGGLGTTSGNTLTTQFATLANWQIAYTVPQDANSIQANPNHISATDLHIPVGSPNAGAGIAIAGVTVDIDGELRDASVDIGADDPTGVLPPANDMAATAFLNPLNGSTRNAIVPFIPQATFANNGTNSQTNVTVRFRIINSLSVIVYNNTQTIASIPGNGGTANVTFSSVLLPVDSYTMQAISELTGDANLLNDTLNGSFTVLAPLSGVYTVGVAGNYASLTNPGGIFDDLNQRGAASDITVNIISDLAGETGTHALNELAGGYAVSMQPTGGPRTVTGSNTGALIKLNGTDKVTINGSTAGASATGCLIGGNAAIRELTFQNTNTGTSAAVIAVQTGTNGAKNNIIKNVNVLGQDPTTTLLGISIGGNTPGSVGADNDSNRVENCSVRRAVFGIYASGASAANMDVYTVITQNDLDSTSATDRIRRVGILLFNDSIPEVTYNSISGINTNESADAIGIALGNQAIDATITTSGSIVGALVANNRIAGVASLSTTGFSAAGITVAGGATGANTIRNNMITGVTAPATSPDLVAGIYVVGATGANTRLYHNSVAMTGDRGTVATQMPSFGIAITGTDPTVDLRNNILYTTQIASGGGVNAVSYAIGMVSTTFTNLNSNYNAFWSTGANDGGFRTGSLSTASGTSYAALAAWQTAVADDANSLEVDPGFVSPLNDLHINPAVCTFKGLGTPITGITDDYDCNGRSTTLPDIGADEFNPAATVTTTLAGSISPGAIANESVRYTVNGTTDYLYYCDRIIATLTPAGALPVSGNVTVGVRIDTGATQMGTARLYAARFYDILPVNNAATATGTVKLYFVQSEFDNYNAKALDSNYYPLPLTGGGNTDSLRILIYHGAPSGGYFPGNYSGAVEELSTADAGVSVVWNPAGNNGGGWWEVSFPANGFSGYFISSKPRTPLPIKVEYFRGAKQGSSHVLDWKVVPVNTVNGTLSLERSSDGRSFSSIYSITASAVRMQQPFNYATSNLLKGTNYYRLKLTDDNGVVTYSGIVALLNSSKGFELVNITPNPVTEGRFKLNITAAEQLKMEVVVTDMAGRIVSRQTNNLISGFNAIEVNVNTLANGMYQVMGIIEGERTKTLKFVKE